MGEGGSSIYLDSMWGPMRLPYYNAQMSQNGARRFNCCTWVFFDRGAREIRKQSGRYEHLDRRREKPDKYGPKASDHCTKRSV